MCDRPPATPTIRRATPDDAAALARLRWDFTAELDEPSEELSSFAPRFADTLGEYLASGRWTIWVAELDGRLIGNAWVERVDKVPRPYRRAVHWSYVTNVYVAPEHRNAGLGGRLLAAAVEEAQRTGSEFALLWPSELSRRFYARAGFRPNVDGVIRLLEAD